MAFGHHEDQVAVRSAPLRGNRPALEELHLESGPVDDEGVLADDLCRAARRQRLHVEPPGDVMRNHGRRGKLRKPFQLLVRERRHRAGAFRQALALLRIVQPTGLRQNEPVVACVLDHLRRPDHAAAGIVAAEDRHQHAVLLADVLEPPEDAGRDVEDVALLQHHLARSAPAAPEEPPAAFQNEEHFRGPVRMQRIPAVRRLACRADVEAGRFADVDMLVRTLGHAPANDREVLLPVRTRRVRVDEGGAARHEFAVADDPPVHLLDVHSLLDNLASGVGQPAITG